MVLRLVQGFGLGGEYGGAALMTIESAPEAKGEDFRFAPTNGSLSWDNAGDGVFALCNHFPDQEEFLDWGWRIPFGYLPSC